MSFFKFSEGECLEETVNWRPKGSSRFKSLGSCLALVASLSKSMAHSMCYMLPPPVAHFGWDPLYLPSNPWVWPPEEPSFPLGSIPGGDWHNSCLGFHYVKVFILLSPTLPETSAFDHFGTD